MTNSSFGISRSLCTPQTCSYSPGWSYMILAFYPSPCTFLSAGQLPRGMYTRLMLSINGVCVSCWESNGAEWRCKTENWATTSFGYCPSTATLPVRPHCANARRIRCQEDLKQLSLLENSENRDTPILCRWRLPSRTWNHWTDVTLHSGEWCLHLALRTHSGACQNWMNEWQTWSN